MVLGVGRGGCGCGGGARWCWRWRGATPRPCARTVCARHAHKTGTDASTSAYPTWQSWQRVRLATAARRQWRSSTGAHSAHRLRRPNRNRRRASRPISFRRVQPVARFAVMLLRALVPVQALARRALSTPSLRPRMHLPLGVVPDDTDLPSVRSKWGSDAMDKIQSMDVIEVDGDVAICDGGGGPLGHPIEYIKLNVSDEDAAPQVCKYCGLRFVRKRY